MEDTLKVIEAYAKTYLFHIMAFFGDLKEGDTPPPELRDGTLLVFGLINAVIGAALQGLFVQKLRFNDINFPQSVILEVCYWMAICVVLQVALSGAKRPAHFADSITAVLRVFPVAFVVGSYAAFIAYFALIAFTPSFSAPWGAAMVMALMQFAILVRYFPPAVRDIRGPSKARKLLAACAVLGLVLFIHWLIVFANTPSTAKAGAPAPKPTASAPKTAVAGSLAAIALAVLLALGLPPGRALADPVATPPAAAASCGDPADGRLFQIAWCNSGKAARGVGHGVMSAGRWIGRMLAGPAVSAPSPTAVPHDFILRLASDGAAFTAEDQALLQAAADYARAAPSRRIEVEAAPSPAVGDGDPATVAQSRAMAVRSQLVGLGVPDQAIAVGPPSASKPPLDPGAVRISVGP